MSITCNHCSDFLKDHFIHTHADRRSQHLCLAVCINSDCSSYGLFQIPEEAMVEYNPPV